MEFLTQVDLSRFNTLRLPTKTAYYIKVENKAELEQSLLLARNRNLSVFVLGGGSNTVLTKDLDGLVVHMAMKGKQVVEESDDSILLQLAAGEDWHETVTYCVDKNWGGIENLALIPGTVGAAPVQNIAAYGQNLSDVFESLEIINIHDGQIHTLGKQACRFGYRDSIFKHDLKNQSVITAVTLKLNKHPILETSYYSIGGLYDSLEKELSVVAAPPYTIRDIYKAVINIRTRKLLHPDQFPTVGSFFINPVVTLDKLKALRSKITDLQFYPLENLNYVTDNDLAPNVSEVKIPAGRLIEFLGWRGRQVGNCFVSPKAATIFSHNGRATGHEFLAFTDMIKADVKRTFGIELQSEVNII